MLRTHDMLDFLFGDFFQMPCKRKRKQIRTENSVSEKMGDSISFFPAVALDLIVISIICKLIFQLLSSPVPFFFLLFQLACAFSFSKLISGIWNSNLFGKRYVSLTLSDGGDGDQELNRWDFAL